MKLFSLTLILFLFSCSSLKSNKKTEVIIIGTFHNMHKTMPYYHFDTIKHLLDITKPDVLALEIREKDLTSEYFSNAPYDISNIAIPWARNNNVAIRAIDWWEDNYRESHNEYIQKLKQSKKGRIKLSKALDEIEIHSDSFRNFSNMTLKYVHSEAFVSKDKRVRSNHTKLFGEGPGNLYWYTRADRMNALLGSVIKDNKYKRIVVLTGAAHRGDFEEYINNLKDVRYIPLSEIVNYKKLPEYDLKSKSLMELKDIAFSIVQGPLANRHPDLVNINFLNDILVTLKEKESSKATAIYIKGEISYFRKNYVQAYKMFNKLGSLANNDYIFGFKLSDFSQIRSGNMLDLLKRRKDSENIYKSLLKKNNKRLKYLSNKYLRSPYFRP